MAIGLVVDDAIVVLENIYRHVEEGMAPLAAAYQGAKEVGFAVVAMTLTLAAVYAPVVFTTGRTGKLFVEFALTLAGAVLVSGFVALTLSPMMCALLLKHSAPTGRLNPSVWIESGLKALESAYGRTIGVALRLRWAVVLLALGVAGTSAWLLVHTKRELAPIEDRGTVLSIFSGPDGASIDYTSKYALQIEKIANSVPEVDRFFVVSGNPTVTQGIAFMRLTDWDQRSRKVQDIAKEVQPKLLSIPGVNAFAVTPPSLGQSPRERPINVVIVTNDDYPKLAKVVQKILEELQRWPGLQGTDSDLRLNKPELKIQLDRDRVADAGVQVEQIGRLLETALVGVR